MLLDLASNADLAAPLKIRPEEWRALRSLESPTTLTVNGYIAVLMTIRGSATES